ncbi:hypothetical protein HW132_01190 [Brasilonema sp. CT11]|nr:hypothetical protein [Brasilonema sp. CT11]
MQCNCSTKINQLLINQKPAYAGFAWSTSDFDLKTLILPDNTLLPCAKHYAYGRPISCAIGTAAPFPEAAAVRFALTGAVRKPFGRSAQPQSSH